MTRFDFIGPGLNTELRSYNPESLHFFSSYFYYVLITWTVYILSHLLGPYGNVKAGLYYIFLYSLNILCLLSYITI